MGNPLQKMQDMEAATRRMELNLNQSNKKLAKLEAVEEKRERKREQEEQTKEELAKLKAVEEERQRKREQEPWRELPPGMEVWNAETLKDVKWGLKKKIKNSKLKGTTIRLLLIGDTGNGKSSLINSMNAALTGDVVQIALTGSDSHVTKRYLQYPLVAVDENDEDDEEWMLPFLVCDFRGFGSKDKGVPDEAVLAALRGVIQHNQEITSSSRDFTGREPHDDNMLTYIGIVVGANIVGTLGTKDEPFQGSLKSMKDAIYFGHDNDMPTIVFLTMCDKIDPDLMKNPDRLYHSKPVEEAVQKAESIFGISRNMILPVKNFTQEVHVTPKMALQFIFPLTYLLKQIEGIMRIRRMQKEMEGAALKESKPDDKPAISKQNADEESATKAEKA